MDVEARAQKPIRTWCASRGLAVNFLCQDSDRDSKSTSSLFLGLENLPPTHSTAAHPELFAFLIMDDLYDE